MKKIIFALFFIFCPIFIFAAERVEINTASLEQLEMLTGIGPVKAQAMIDARPFSSVDDLIRVKGIGEKTLQKIKEQRLAYVDSQSKIASPSSADSARNDETNNSSLRGSGEAADEAIPTTEIASSLREVVPRNDEIVYPKRVIINEILPNPKGPDEENEWIEIYNQNNFEVDLFGWKIEDAKGAKTIYTFEKNAKISPNGFLVLKRPKTKITLNNSEDGLNLIRPDNKIVDSLSYVKSPINQSYNKTSSGFKWSSSLTPGAKNIITAPEAKNDKKGLLKTEKSGNNKTGAGLAGLKHSDFNPWLLFIIVLIITLILATIVLLIKFKIHRVK